MAVDSMSIDSIESFYRSLQEDGDLHDDAKLILHLTDWFMRLCVFDESTGYPLPGSLTEVLAEISKLESGAVDTGLYKDRLTRIVDHVMKSLEHILRHPRDKIKRNHEMLPIHAAREVDVKTIQWLSKQTGRTIREKLNGKPYLKAVKRRVSYDTLENRVLKAFVTRLLELLEVRGSTLSEKEEYITDLEQDMSFWLRNEADEIQRWNNLPPNNTLLEDKHYSKIWDAWMWLQNLDNNIQMDQNMLSEIVLTYVYWRILAFLSTLPQVRLLQQPCPFGNIKLKMKPVLPVEGCCLPAKAEGTRTGSVLKTFEDKGFGFIACYDKEWFFHVRDLASGTDFSDLKIGLCVLFEAGHNDKGECAKNVRPFCEAVPLELAYHPARLSLGNGQQTIEIDLSGDKFRLRRKGNVTQKTLDLHDITQLVETVSSQLVGGGVGSCAEYDRLNGDHLCIDLISTRPQFSIDEGPDRRLPFRLLTQYWPHEEFGVLETDCGTATAFGFHEGIETVSMLDALSNQPVNKALIGRATNSFVGSISEFIEVPRLTYLVPDALNDFALENVRKAANFHFEDSTPLPKSIAAIFAWQSSKRFEADAPREGDFVLVIDAFRGGISITPVQARYENELIDRLPESQGITWERHPTLVVEHDGLVNAVTRNLSQDDCSGAEEFTRLFGFDGLVSEAGILSLVDAGSWYHVPDDIRDILSRNVEGKALSAKVFNQCLNSTGRDCRKAKVFFLPLKDIIKKPEREGKWFWLGSAWSLTKGCQALIRWQEEVDDIALWRDHLPELSVSIVREGRYENFYLVKDATVTPRLGRTVAIPLEESFTLPAGQPYYSFPLLQGEGNQELQFVAYLKSSAFPLQEDTECSLHMTYTYGADDPYELKFIPLDSDKAGFKSIRVEWRSASEEKTADLENLPVPDFPKTLDWREFYEFKSNQGKSIDIYKEINHLSDYVADIACYVAFAEGYTELNQSSRHIGIVQSIEEREIDGKISVCGRVSSSNGSIQFRWGPKNIKEGDEVNFEIKKKGRFINANKISKGRRLPTNYSNRLKNELSLHLKRIMAGHSLVDPLCPPELQNSIQSISSSLSTVLSYAKDKSLKESAYLVYACLNDYCPAGVGQTIGTLVDSDIQTYWEHAAYCIGNSLTNWQEDVFKKVISMTNSKELSSLKLVILSIALWRSKELINKLSVGELRDLSQNLYECLDSDTKMLVNGWKGFQISTLCKHLELLLALLRSRGNEDDGFKTIFAPANHLTPQYVTLVDDISRVVMEKGIKLKSRISLQIDKPEMFRSTPDLLYALRMYLTGDSGASTIMITGVTDDD